MYTGCYVMQLVRLLVFWQLQNLSSAFKPLAVVHRRLLERITGFLKQGALEFQVTLFNHFFFLHKNQGCFTLHYFQETAFGGYELKSFKTLKVFRMSLFYKTHHWFMWVMRKISRANIVLTITLKRDLFHRLFTCRLM